MVAFPLGLSQERSTSFALTTAARKPVGGLSCRGRTCDAGEKVAVIVRLRVTVTLQVSFVPQAAGDQRVNVEPLACVAFRVIVRPSLIEMRHTFGQDSPSPLTDPVPLPASCTTTA